MVTTYIRTTAHTIAAIFTLMILEPTAGFAANDLATTVNFNIPPQSLSGALLKYSEQSGVQVTSSSKLLIGLVSKGIVGELEARSALQQLLVGTTLGYEAVDDRTVTIFSTKPDVLQQTSAVDAAPLEPTLHWAQAEQTKVEMQKVEAQPSSASIEEIVVTAQKREERAIDVPISVTAISGAALERAGIQSFQDLSYAVPGMTAVEVGPGTQGIVLRGISGNRGPSPVTGIYIDEMGLAASQLSLVPSSVDAGTLDLSRVEVLKGPQGTLFGEGSMGGTIRYITNDPNLHSVSAKLSTNFFGNEDSKDMSGEVSGVLNLPLVEDRLGLRIVAKYENEAGWIDRLGAPNGSVIEHDFNDYENTQVRVKGLWVPAEALEVRVLAIVNRGEGGGSNIANTGSDEDSNFVYERFPDTSLSLVNDFQMFNLTATYDAGWAQLLSSTSYADIDSVNNFLQRRPLVLEATLQPVGFQEIFAHDMKQVTHVASQEFRLSSAGSGSFTWVVGGNAKDSYSSRRLVSDILRFNQPTSPTAIGSVSPKTIFKSQSWAVFGDASYALTPRFKLGAGVRYFKDEPDTYIDSNPVASRQQGEFDATTYRTYLSYAVQDDLNVYGSVATGFRSGGFNGVGVAPYEPEEVTSYELGTKMRLAEGRIGLEMALFRSDYTDVIVNSFFLNPAVVLTSENAGEARIEGVEAALDVKLTGRWNLHLNGDITDAEYTKTVALPFPQRAPVDVGDPMEYVPEYSYSVGSDYDFHWATNVAGYVSAQFNVQGQATLTARTPSFVSAFGPTISIPQQSTPVLRFVNFAVGGEWSRWNLELYGRNLLNEDGALRPGFGLTSQARPRTFGFKAAKSF